MIDGTENLSLPVLPGGMWENLKNRAASIFGKNVYAGMARVEGKTEGMAVLGLVSRPDALCATRANQHYFVNRRPVSRSVHTSGGSSSDVSPQPDSEHCTVQRLTATSTSSPRRKATACAAAGPSTNTGV